MLRLALTRRWLLAAVGVLVAVGVCLLAGHWQWQRTQDLLAAERAAVASPVAVESVVAPGTGELEAGAIGRRVTAEGTYDASLQAVVPNRLHDGEPGVWVVTGLRLADGSALAVLRGSLPTADDPGAAVPTGPVEVSGVLQPDEPFYAGAGVGEGEVAAIDHARLAELWGTGVLPGFVTLGGQEPAASPAPTPVAPTIEASDIPFPLQNFFYALEWWVFAAFAVAVYLRWLWLESRRTEAAAAPEPVA